MKFDELGLLITQEPAPGCYGDSCAETSRLGLLSIICGATALPQVKYFMTPHGILRHPYSPWREDDTSWDQKLPLYLYLEAEAPNSAHMQMYKSLDWFWPLKNFTGMRTFIQSLLFKLPYRWDDGHKRFQRTSESSCDYLNFTAQILFAYITKRENILHRTAMRIITRGEVKAKIKQYYSNDPRNGWLVHLYEVAIDGVWL